MEVSGKHCAQAALPTGEVTLASIDRRLGYSQSQSGHGSEGNNSAPSGK